MTITDEREGWDRAIRYSAEIGRAVALFRMLLAGNRKQKRVAEQAAQQWLAVNDAPIRDRGQQ